MNDQMISLETSELAQTKGFDRFKIQTPITLDNGDNYYPLITQSFLQKWLRDIHGLHCLIIPVVTMGYTFKIVKVWKKDFNPEADGATEIETPPYKGVHSYDYSTYEEALESALQEMLKIMKEDEKKPDAFTNATPSYGWKDRIDYKKENRGWISPCKDRCLETESFKGTEYEGVNVCEDGCVRATKVEEALNLSKEDILHAVTFRRAKMRKETWIKNVMKVFPERSLEDTEALYEKLFTSRGSSSLDTGPMPLSFASQDSAHIGAALDDGDL